MIFVDTGAWYALVVPTDPNFLAADAWLAANHEPLVTTDFVVDELLTLLKMRGEYQRAQRFGESLFAGTVARLEWVLPDDVRQAWASFRDFSDKRWSFTDCVSRVVMRRLGITSAFAFDNDFRQFGQVIVLP